MTLPPERITVKRRRDEDPVGALYIRKRHQASAVWRLEDSQNEEVRYARGLGSGGVQVDKNFSPSSNAISPNPEQQGLTSRPFQDLENDSNRNATGGGQHNSVPVTRPAGQGSATHLGARPEPRRFHLTKTLSFAQSPYSVSKVPIERHSRNWRNNLAVFVEKAGNIRERDIAAKTGGNEYALSQLNKGIEKPSNNSDRVRKRPNATAAEQKWRADNWSRTAVSNEKKEYLNQSDQGTEIAPNNRTRESPELAEQLQQFALQETQPQEDSFHCASNPQTHLKVKPKPPKPRPSGLEQQDDKTGFHDAMIGSSCPDDDMDFVYDTYVRSTADPAISLDSSELFVNPEIAAHSSNFGLLIIEDEQEALWETLGEEQASDTDWNSEEEDENAEDFYGNDYPEDEVNSDDEYDRGAYNYRHGASDDEEFGEEVASWSNG